MNQAFVCARRAAAHGDVPIGAVIVRDGKIIARGENRVQLKRDPTLHAEIVALRRACAKTGEKILDGCDIYITLEPCAMCATALAFAHIKNIYFAAADAKGGAVLHNARVYDTDKHLWKPNIVQMPQYADAASQMLRDFFKSVRANK